MSSDTANKYDVKVDSSVYSRFVLHLWFSRNWVWFAVPLCITASLAFVSVDAALCIAIILGVAVPMVMAIVYYWLILTPTSVCSLIGKQVSICNDGISLEFAPASAMKNKKIPYHDIHEIYSKDNLFAIALKGSSYNFLLLPKEMLTHKDIEKIVSGVKQTN